MSSKDNRGERTTARLAVASRYQRQLPTYQAVRSALIVIDMQKIFQGLWAGNNNHQDLNELKELTSCARQAGWTVIRTQHGHRDPGIDGGELHGWWGSSIIEGSKDHDFISGFAPVGEDILIKKRRYSAFHDTQLDKILRQRGIQTVVISGVMTNLCCETTARDAFCRDYSVIFLVDGTATATESMHRGTLLNLGFGFAHLLSCRQMIQTIMRESIE